MQFWLDGKACPIYDYDEKKNKGVVAQFPWTGCYKYEGVKFGPLELGDNMDYAAARKTAQRPIRTEVGAGPCACPKP